MATYHKSIRLLSVFSFLALFLFATHDGGTLSAVAITPTLTPASTNGQIIFKVQGDGSSAIYTMNTDGSNSHVIAQSVADPLAWSPDSKHIAFIQYNSEGESLSIMDADGSDHKALFTIEPDIIPRVADAFSTISWSPNSNQITFDWVHSSAGAYTPLESEIDVINVDGSNRYRLIGADEPAHVTEPVWLADGQSIAYQVGIEGCDSLYRSDVNGQNQQYVSGWPGDITSGCLSNSTWSPDNRYVAFNTGANLGTDVIKVRDTFLRNDYYFSSTGHQPMWSPDGKHIAFIYNGDRRICVADVNGKNMHCSKVNHKVRYPSWSPDGKHIIYVVEEANHDGEIFVIDTNGSNERLLIMMPFDAFGYQLYSPLWQPHP